MGEVRRGLVPRPAQRLNPAAVAGRLVVKATAKPGGGVGETQAAPRRSCAAHARLATRVLPRAPPTAAQVRRLCVPLAPPPTSAAQLAAWYRPLLADKYEELS